MCFQEFCLFAVVGLVSDFFLQMFFFTTVLSIDIRRMEVRPLLPTLHRRCTLQNTNAVFLNFLPSAGRPEPPPACRSRAPPAQAGPSASARCPPAPTTLSPHHHPADTSLQDPEAPQEAACGLFPGPHSPGPAHHHGQCRAPPLSLAFNYSHLIWSLHQAGTVIWIGILVYTDPAGIRTYLAAQVSEQSPLEDPGAGGLPPHLGVAPVFTRDDPTSTLSIHPAPDPTPLPDNQSEGHHGPARAGLLPQASPTVPQISWSAEDEEGWRRLSFRHWPSLFSYYNITLAKRCVNSGRRESAWIWIRPTFTSHLSPFRYISILPVIPVTVHVSPQEAVETRHPQDTRHPPPPIPKLPADLQTDLTLYKSVLLYLAFILSE